ETFIEEVDGPSILSPPTLSHQTLSKITLSKLPEISSEEYLFCSKCILRKETLYILPLSTNPVLLYSNMELVILDVVIAWLPPLLPFMVIPILLWLTSKLSNSTVVEGPLPAISS